MSNNPELNANQDLVAAAAEGQQGRVPVHENPASESPPPLVPSEDSAVTQRLPTPDAIVSLAIEAEAELFLNQYKEEYAWVPVEEPEPHHECVNIGSKDFQFWLLKLCERRSDEIPRPGTLRDACNILKLQAIRNGQRDLSNRTAFVDGKILIDQATRNGKVIEVDLNSWKVIAPEQPYFVRLKHQLPLPEPVTGGNWNELFRFLNLDDPSEQLLVLAWLLSAYHPNVQSPILQLIGPQGSAKTTSSRRLRSMIDPSVTAMLGETEADNLFQTFHHHAVPCFENVADFNRRTADMFCRAVTGTGIERRKLFTDQDQVLYEFRRPIIINSIGIPSLRPDFLDRSLVIHCKRMETFQLLEKLDEEFESIRPKLLGSLLTLLSKTLSLLNEIPADSEFRMADFARFGRAVARAVGKSTDDFDSIYRTNIAEQTADLLDNSLLAAVLVEFSKEKAYWSGSATDLHKKLVPIAKRLEFFGTKAKLPANARWLSSGLSELAHALKAKGLLISKAKRIGRLRPWTIEKLPTGPASYLDELEQI